MKKYKVVFVMCASLLLMACGNRDAGVPSKETALANGTMETNTEEVQDAETNLETAVQETENETGKNGEEEAFDENELYDQFIEGNITDSNGNNCGYAKNDPYYEDFCDLKWAVYDLNGDGIKELMPREYRSYTPEVYSCRDGEIITCDNEVFGSEGGFVNTKNQLVATDCTHANRNQYLVSEFTGEEKVNIVLFFAKWWEDEDNQDDAEYVKYEGNDYWDISYEDYTVITKEEYDSLVEEYTQTNNDIVFISR